MHEFMFLVCLFHHITDLSAIVTALWCNSGFFHESSSSCVSDKRKVALEKALYKLEVEMTNSAQICSYMVSKGEMTMAQAIEIRRLYFLSQIVS